MFDPGLISLSESWYVTEHTADCKEDVLCIEQLFQGAPSYTTPYISNYRLEQESAKKNEKISVKVHGHHGSKQARKMAKEQAVQRYLNNYVDFYSCIILMRCDIL